MIGLVDAPSEETIQQILASYTSTVPEVEVATVEIDGLKVLVLSILWNEGYPFLANRDVSGKLSKSEVYYRRGTTNGVLSAAEVFELARQKNARVGAVDPEPVIVGFIQEPRMHTSQNLVYRLRNEGNEPIAGISTLIDYRLFLWPQSRVRNPGLHDVRLKPGEERDVEESLNALPFDKEGRGLAHTTDFRRYWIDATLWVKYRQPNGFLRQVSAEATLDCR